MAQYNLLGGVNPINPEYEQQQAMLGKGTNWAEYGLRKEALKEQKKANKMNTIMNGINTAFKVYDAYQQSKEFELQKESQDLINTEREITIQSKRIDLDAKKVAADEDKEYIDGLMKYIEAGDDVGGGAWVMSHPKAANRNADTTWGYINRLRTTQGDTQANRLLSYALPQQYEQRRQFEEQQRGANQRAYLAYQGQQLSAASRIQAANIRANSQMYEAELEAGAKLYGGFGGLMSTEGVPGIVNQEQAGLSQKLQDNLKRVDNIVYNSPDISSTMMRTGLLNETGQLTLNTLRDFNARGNKIQITDIKTVIDKMESMTGLSGADLLGFVQQYGAYENSTPQKTPSGKQVRNVVTKEDVVDLMSPYSSSIQKSLTDYLQQTIDNPDKEPTNAGEGVIQFVDASGRTIDAMIGTKEELKAFQDTVQSMIGYNSQMTQARDFTERTANAMAKLGTRFGDSMARIGRDRLALIDAQNETYHDVPARNTKGEIVPGIMTRQHPRLPDKPIIDATGNIVGYTTSVNPEGEYESTERRARKEAMFQKLQSEYRENPKETMDEAMKMLGIPTVDSLTLYHITRFVDLKKPLSQAKFNTLSPGEKEFYYNEIKSNVGNILRNESIKEATEQLRIPERDYRAKEHLSQQQAKDFIKDLKAVLSQARLNIQKVNNSDLRGDIFDPFPSLRAEFSNETMSKAYSAIKASLDSMDDKTVYMIANRVNKILEKLGREPISLSTKITSTIRGRIADNITYAINDTVRRDSSQKGGVYRTSSGYPTRKSDIELEQDIKLLYDLFDTFSKGE